MKTKFSFLFLAVMMVGCSRKEEKPKDFGDGSAFYLSTPTYRHEYKSDTEIKRDVMGNYVHAGDTIRIITIQYEDGVRDRSFDGDFCKVEKVVYPFMRVKFENGDIRKFNMFDVNFDHCKERI